MYAWDPNAAEWSETPELCRRFVYYNWLPLLELDATDPEDVTILRKYTWGLDLAGQSRDREGAVWLDDARGRLDAIASRQGRRARR